jgi:hypothetical protein
VIAWSRAEFQNTTSCEWQSQALKMP